MTILLLKGYNNYFNRIHKSEIDITSYKEASTSYLEYPNVNFDMQDGILTSLVVGSEGQLDNGEILKFEDLGCPDYLIVHENNVIKSRWFIVESVKIRGGQFKLALKRDVLTDFNSQIVNSPCFVEKGYINDPENPLLLNSEGFVGNQRKQEEYLLRDKTNCAWLVGYLKKDMNSAQTITCTLPGEPAGVPDLDQYEWVDCITFRDLDGTESNAVKTAAFANDDKSTIKFRTYYPGWDDFWGAIQRNIQSTFSLSGNLIKNNYNAGHGDWQGMNSTALDCEYHYESGSRVKELEWRQAEQLGKEIFDHTFHWGYVKGYFDTLIAATKYNATQGNALINVNEDLTKYNNQLFKYNNKVYRLRVGQGTEKSVDTYYTGQDTLCNDYLSALYYKPFRNFQLLRNQDNPTRKKVKITLVYREYAITAVEEPYGTAELVLPAPSQRNQCDDAMYDIFAMPVSPSAFGLDVADTDLIVATPGADIGDSATGEGIIDIDTCSVYQLAIAQTMATKFGAGTQAGYVYDLQLLPYCPFNFSGEDVLFVKTHGYGPYMNKHIIMLEELNSVDYTVINRHDVVEGETVDVPVGVVFYPTKANFFTHIDLSIPATTVHDEWLEVKNPVLLSQGRTGDLTRWSIHEGFPYPITEGPWGIGPNQNNTNVDVELSDGLTNEDCEYISLYSSPSITADGYYKPFLSITSEELPLQPADDYSTKYTANFTIRVKAHWILPDRAEDKKLKNECDFYRLTSPNYNSFYEFKATKLYDGINELRAICTYKPYTPYIKINPQLDKSLYSIKDYNDNIGLMLGGDYSLPMMSDAMINYELQNRNYQAIFNRDLQSLDVNQRIAREQLDFQGLTGTIMGGFTGSAAGLSAGMKTGNPYVAAVMAAAGGIAGNVLPAVGWAKDKEWLEQQQYDARDYAIDQFNYKMGNIQALPQSMTKSTPLSFNNKVWPILEYFSCTPEEKEVLEKKLKYDGMTIMAIGTLADYRIAGGYLKGKMIRLNDLNDDSHIANAIYEEVSKGFYEGE